MASLCLVYFVLVCLQVRTLLAMAPVEGGRCRGDNMIYEPADDQHGFCSCISSRLVYWASEDRCYLLNSKGPCGTNHHVTVTKTGDVRCHLRPCPSSVDNGAVIDYIQWTDGKCYQEDTRGPCPEDYVLRWAGRIRPECVQFHREGSSGSLHVTKEKGDCPEGTQRDSYGKCQQLHPVFIQMCFGEKKWDPVKMICM